MDLEKNKTGGTFNPSSITEYAYDRRCDGDHHRVRFRGSFRYLIQVCTMFNDGYIH